MASHNVPRTAITEQRTDAQIAKDKIEVDNYRRLVDEITAKIDTKQYSPDLLDLTSRILVQNPEYYTIWNARRRLLISGISSTLSCSYSPSKESHNISQTNELKASSGGSSSFTSNTLKDSNAIPPCPDPQNPGKNGTASEIIELITKDLDFVFPLLKNWPKCYWIWNHRVWLLNLASEKLPIQQARKLWEGELTLVSMMLVKDSRNFHGWGYRRMVVQQLESPKLTGSSMVEDEFVYTTKMINRHLSNFSAWHNRSILIPRLLDERIADHNARKAFLDSEFDIIREALWTDSYDQSLWFYYQYLMSNLATVNELNMVPDFTMEDRATYIDRQLVELRDLLDGAEDCKWIYNALLDYTVTAARLRNQPLGSKAQQDLKYWLGELRKLDPFRKGRWNQIEIVLQDALQ